jgi:hypothetical protein
MRSRSLVRKSWSIAESEEFSDDESAYRACTEVIEEERSDEERNNFARFDETTGAEGRGKDKKVISCARSTLKEPRHIIAEVLLERFICHRCSATTK